MGRTDLVTEIVGQIRSAGPRVSRLPPLCTRGDQPVKYPALSPSPVATQRGESEMPSIE
jgi:hypothetical protein